MSRRESEPERMQQADLHRSDGELLEFIRSAVETTGPCDQPSAPYGSLDRDQWRRAREGEAFPPAALRATAVWQTNCDRALQLSRKRLGSLLWALEAASARSSDERFASAVPHIASKMALFGVSVVPSDPSERRRLVERWTCVHDQEMRHQVERTEAS